MLRKKVNEKDGSAQVGAAVQKAVNYEVSIADLARRSEKRAWIVAMLSMLVTVMTAGGYYYMLPLKEKVPYLVMADAYSGTSTIAKLEANYGGARSAQVRHWLAAILRVLSLPANPMTRRRSAIATGILSAQWPLRAYFLSIVRYMQLIIRLDLSLFMEGIVQSASVS